MRVIPAILTFVAIAAATPAQAEKRTFIVASNADGYGIDRCLATGALCGSAAATAYCRTHEFSQAISFRKVDRDDVTGAAGSNACSGVSCDEFVAIECGR